jgi:hypothetical protein
MLHFTDLLQNEAFLGISYSTFCLSIVQNHFVFNVVGVHLWKESHSNIPLEHSLSKNIDMVFVLCVIFTHCSNLVYRHFLIFEMVQDL